MSFGAVADRASPIEVLTLRNVVPGGKLSEPSHPLQQDRGGCTTSNHRDIGLRSPLSLPIKITTALAWQQARLCDYS